MRHTLIVLASLAAMTAPAAHSASVFTATGADAAAIAPVVDDFRDALGALNAPEPVNVDGGRREINWDAAPDAISQPNAFPPDFFNANFSPRARGLEVRETGTTTSFSLSATAASGVTPAFGFPLDFLRFSEERLFTPVGGTTFDILFFDPTEPARQALSSGFGAIFSDVELVGVSTLQFFGLDDTPLQIAGATDGLLAADPFDGGLSFLGVDFGAPVLARVAVVTGDNIFDGSDFAGSGDSVVMDDFIFGEPTPVPLPATAVLLGAALVGLGTLRRRRSRG